MLRNARNSKTVCSMDTIKVKANTQGCVSRSISLNMSFSPSLPMPSLACWRLRGNDTVAKLPRLPRETRRLSCGRIDGVDAMPRRLDAVFMIT